MKIFICVVFILHEIWCQSNYVINHGITKTIIQNYETYKDNLTYTSLRQCLFTMHTFMLILHLLI